MFKKTISEDDTPFLKKKLYSLKYTKLSILTIYYTFVDVKSLLTSLD